MEILYDFNSENRVSTITLAPLQGKPPVFDEEVLHSLDIAVTRSMNNDSSLLVIRSNSEKFFCLGANISVLQTMTVDNISEWVRRGNEVFRKIERLAFPTVSQVRGYAMGGGLELALATDIIVASEKAIFSQSESKLGFIPGWGGTFRLKDRIGRHFAKRMYFTAEMISAERSLQIGLIDYFFNEASFEEQSNALICSISDNSKMSLSMFKKFCDNEDSLAYDEKVDQEILGSISCVASEDTAQRVNKFLKK